MRLNALPQFNMSMYTCHLVTVDLLRRASNAGVEASSCCSHLDVGWDVASVQAGHAKGTFLCGRGCVQPPEVLLALPFAKAQQIMQRLSRQASFVCKGLVGCSGDYAR